MTKTSFPLSHEQKRIEELLLKLAKMKPNHGKPASIAGRHQHAQNCLAIVALQTTSQAVPHITSNPDSTDSGM